MFFPEKFNKKILITKIKIKIIIYLAWIELNVPTVVHFSRFIPITQLALNLYSTAYSPELYMVKIKSVRTYNT